MTKSDIEDRRLRRLEKRIRHLEALLRVTAIFGGNRQKRIEDRVRRLWMRESAAMLEMLKGTDPEDAARQPAREPGRSR